MEVALTEIARLVAADAKHIRKGWRLSTRTDADTLSSAREELGELADAPGDIGEMADVMTCLLHHCFHHGWSLADVEAEILAKLRLRFEP